MSNFMENNEASVQMPIDRFSYSSLTQLLRNPLIFKLKHILGVYDGKIGPSGMVGRAGHKALEAYYGGNDEVIMGTDRAENIAAAIQVGYDYLEEYQDIYIDYGKTGSREKMIASYAQAMRFYFAEEPEYHEILAVEEKMDAEIETIDGQQLPLPAVFVPDLIERRKDGGIQIIDNKFVKTFTAYEEEDWIKIVQSQFAWHVVKKAKDWNADRMIFREIKVSENKDGGPQIRDWAVPFNHEQYRIIFYNLYRDAVNFVKNPQSIYLPNLSDPFDGEQAGLLYAQGLLSADMSDVEVMHKVKDVAFTSKKFVPSRLDRVENQHLLPEEKIKVRLAEFGVLVEPVETVHGASVTQYQFDVSAGISMGVFKKHKADIARAIEAKGDIRILAPIPGTSRVGVEVPTEERTAAKLDEKQFDKGTLNLPVGADVQGKPVKLPLDEMPHLLIAGATGSGKSVLLHTILTALTTQMTPERMQLILIDPKRVELVAFAKKRHLKGGKIVYEYPEAALTLRALLDEMEARYKALEGVGARSIKEYNEKGYKQVIQPDRKGNQIHPGFMPYIVVVIDEFADLMLQGRAAEKKRKSAKSLENIVTRVRVEAMARRAAKMGMRFKPDLDEENLDTIEDMIVRLAQMARAVGIHLIIATQRPSVDVITGLIKANFPTRIALTTSSPTDSKVILGTDGAEKLTGKGDMLLQAPSLGTVRLQGYITE